MTAAEPVPYGSLGVELARLLDRPQRTVLTVGVVVVLVALLVALPLLAGRLATLLGYAPAVWLLAAVSIGALVLLAGVVAFVPVLLLPARDRVALAVHSWVGAREVRRLFGSTAGVTAIPTSPEAADAWLAATAGTERLQPLRVEALIMARRMDEARVEAERLPATTAFEAYRRRDVLALIDDQAGTPVDEAALSDAAAAVPDEIERAEAYASRAILLARRRLRDGDWREPLVAARAGIPGSDTAILARDHSWPIFRILVRTAVVPIAVLVVAIAVVLTVVLPLVGG